MRRLCRYEYDCAMYVAYKSPDKILSVIAGNIGYLFVCNQRVRIDFWKKVNAEYERLKENENAV